MEDAQNLNQKRDPVLFIDPDKCDKSLLAELILTEDQATKDTFIKLSNILLNYANVKIRYNWNDISYEFNRSLVARLMLGGKTFSLYLALDPSEYNGTKYRVRDVSDVKKYAKTPSLLRIKAGADTQQVAELVADMMNVFDTPFIGESDNTLTDAAVAYDTPEHLVERGILKVEVKPKRVNPFVKEEKKEDQPAPEAQPQPAPDVNIFSPEFNALYNDTLFFVDGMIDQSPFYKEILRVMREGEAKARLSKRFVLKAIDEAWVTVIEDSINALDELIRKPSHYIEETDKILPIEMTKQINPRSIRHLAQHTDYIAKIEGDEITPTKLLNVFRDDSIMTYENKFVNTLINKLYLFVSRRYDIAAANNLDEQSSRFEFSQDFLHGELKGKINFSIEISQPLGSSAPTEEVKNYTQTTDLWSRVRRLYSITRAYVNSEFARNMDKAYIRPPVMRTNPILKNKNLRQCLALWEFIETYENSGYEMLIQENLENISQDYLKELYSTLAIQYFVFRYNIKNEFVPDKTLAETLTDTPLAPKIVDELKPLESDEFDTGVAKSDDDSPASAKRTKKLSKQAEDILFAVEVALRASEKLQEAQESQGA